MKLSAPHFLITPRLVFFSSLAAVIFVHELSLINFLFPAVQMVISSIILLCFIVALFYSPRGSALFLLFLIVAGLNGSALEFFSISLPILCSALFLCAHGFRMVYNKLRFSLAYTEQRREACLIIGLMLLSGAWGALNGIMQGNNAHDIFTDVVPFIFLMLAIPFLDFMRMYSREKMLRHIIPAIFGVAAAHILLSVAFLILFSTQILAIHDLGYDWLRQTLAGKITAIGTTYRIVFPVFLFTTICGFLFVYDYLETTYRRCSSAAILGALSALHFTRAFIIAYVVSIIIIFRKKSIRPLMLYIFFLFLFLIVWHGLATGSLTAGPFAFLNRTQTSVMQNTDISISARRALLQPIVSSIRTNPFGGSGFGSRIAYWDTTQNKPVMTTHFDWGYLEQIAELGIIGFIPFIYGFYILMRRCLIVAKIQPLGLCGSAILAFLAISQFFLQALFHVYGLLTLAIIIAFAYGEKNS